MVSMQMKMHWERNLSPFFNRENRIGKMIEGFGEQTSHTDYIVPILADPFNILTINLPEWSTKIGRGWSRTPVFPWKC
jgi:hypothetical protein